jgi:uncharacterized protein YlxP (DUF503 family)
VAIDDYLPGTQSLKDKRRRIKSLISRVKNKYNVSIAEVDYNDDRRRAQIGVALVSNDRVLVDRIISKVATMIDNEPNMNMIDYRVEIF